MELTAQWFDRLNWDSNFFGFPVARMKPTVTTITVAAAQAELAQQKIRLVYWSVSPDDVALQAAVTKLGGKLVDKKTTFVKSFTAAPLPATSGLITVTSYTANTMTPELRALAIQAGLFSRFQVDPKIGYDKFVELYCLWMEKSVRRELAEDVLVARDNAKPDQPVIGVATVGQKAGVGDIGLVAVDEHYRGQGIASALMLACDAWFYQQHYQRAQVVTQGDNAAACRLYTKAGYSIGQVEWLYHYWL